MDGLLKRAVFGGFREDDVLEYFEEITKQSAKLHEELQMKIIKLKADNEALKGEIVKLAEQINEEAERESIEAEQAPVIQSRPEAIDPFMEESQAESLAPPPLYEEDAGNIPPPLYTPLEEAPPLHTELQTVSPVQEPATPEPVLTPDMGKISLDLYNEIAKLNAEKSKLTIENKGLQTQIALFNRKLTGTGNDLPVGEAVDTSGLLKDFDRARADILYTVNRINSFTSVNQVFDEKETEYLHSLFDSVIHRLEDILLKTDATNSESQGY
ncbi:MAG: hypothetical protein BGN88_15145 [Clostridiales bacterium 43-6]|nr:MAG: hypothetical protein BGN88_15145 [Clostridiales bacterium 43-6]